LSDPIIVSAVRTAVGTAGKGSFANTSGEQLATAILQEAVRRSGLDPVGLDDVIFAESLYGGGDLARYAAVAAGMTSVAGQAINRHCAGSLTAIGNAAAGVKSGMERAVVAGGVQASSASPRLRQRVLGSAEEYVDWYPPTHPDSPDAPNRDMSITVGWNTAKAAGISREEMDHWAWRSHMRAVAAIDAGKFVEEILPMKVPTADGSLVEFAVDEHPRRTSTLEKLASLKPAFKSDGVITAGNSSQITDGAAAVLVMERKKAEALGLRPRARFHAFALGGVDPVIMLTAPIPATRNVLARAGMRLDQMDVIEINEAFAPVILAWQRELDADMAKVNLNGGAIALGHPLGCSGARLMATLLNILERTGGRWGLQTMCEGGGMANATIIERLG